MARNMKGKKPIKPFMPTLPSRVIPKRETSYVPSRVTLKDILDKVPHDVRFEEVIISGEYVEDDNEITIEWKTDIENPNYDIEYIAYLEGMKRYEKEKRVYDERLKEWEQTEKVTLQQRIAQLEDELKKLQSGVTLPEE